MSISRSFAIGVTEVTVEQFLKFQPDFDYARDYAPEPTCPITMVSYYDALRYCRWLSELEGYREDQMCYPPLEQIRPGMHASVDCLRRPAYRLPTEAEWEFACRAGSTTSRPFGTADDLLPRFAWTVSSSRYRTWPVARLLPNDLGLFDILGNAMEFCQNTHRIHSRRTDGLPRNDDFESAALGSSEDRERRGGAILYQPADARSAHRDHGNPETRFPFMGFRVARTLVP